MPWGWKNPECRNSSRFTATADFLSANNSDIAHYMEQTGGPGKLCFPGCAWKGRFHLPSPFHRPFGSFFRTYRHRSTGPSAVSSALAVTVPPALRQFLPHLPSPFHRPFSTFSPTLSESSEKSESSESSSRPLHCSSGPPLPSPPFQLHHCRPRLFCPSGAVSALPAPPIKNQKVFPQSVLQNTPGDVSYIPEISLTYR